MINIAMRVDLSNFFSDVRRSTLIFIDESLENIKDVQDHIQKLFRLSNICLLTQDGCYLSPKESIKVLSSVESLKACKFPEDELQDASVVINLAETSKKRKNRSAETELEFSSSTPNNPKRTKSKNDTLQSPLKTAITDKTNEMRLTRKSAKNATSQQTAMFNEAENLEVSQDCSVHKTNTTKTSRNCSQTQGETTDRDVSMSSKSNNHIVYEDAEKEVIPALETSSQTVKVNPVDVEFHSSLMDDYFSSVRRFKLPYKPDPVKILEDIVIPAPVKTPEKNVQNVDEPLEAQVATDNGATEAEVPVEKKLVSNNESYELEKECQKVDKIPVTEASSKVAEQSLLESDSEDDVMVLDDTHLDDSNSAEIITDMLPNAEPLTTLPNVGETLIFKLSKAKRALQSSAKTDYIAGTCSYINRRTKSITIAVIACGNATRQVLRQYSNSLDDSTDSDMILTVNFKEMIDAKVIVSAVD
ncbi:coilin [Drosophila innubila]|uniref:coilin n=1 Tax=Drosophila innubila TaxID=198719 RepID=UPI00148DC8F7|nr:coilin [Drosophila innubila]